MNFTEILTIAENKGFKIIDLYKGESMQGYFFGWVKGGKQYGNSINASIPFDYYKAAMEIKPFVTPTMQEVMLSLGLD